MLSGHCTGVVERKEYRMLYSDCVLAWEGLVLRIRSASVSRRRSDTRRLPSFAVRAALRSVSATHCWDRVKRSAGLELYDTIAAICGTPDVDVVAAAKREGTRTVVPTWMSPWSGNIAEGPAARLTVMGARLRGPSGMV